MPNFVYELELAPGINSDDTAFASRGRWADGSNVRFRLGRPEVIGGWTSLATGQGADTRNLFLFKRVSTSTPFLVIGTETNLRIGVFPTGGVSTIATVAATSGWALDSFGEVLLAVPRGDTLYAQTHGGGASAVAAAPDNIQDMLVSDERQVLAFGCNEEISGTFNPRCIRGSDIEDYTDWTTSATNNAFEHLLESDSGIVAGRKIGSYIAVWTSTGLHLGQFVGDPGQTYRFDRIAENCGLLAPNAVTIVHGTAYWVGKDLQFRAWRPGELVRILPCPIGKDFADNIGTTSQTFAWHNSKFNEVWWLYTRASDPEPQHFVALSIGESEAAQQPVWFRGTFGDKRSAIIEAALAEYVGVAMDDNGVVYAHETTAAVAWSLQSADQYIDSGRTRVMVKGILPDFEYQDNAITMSLYMRGYPQGTPVEKGPYTLADDGDKTDFRASGKIMSVKFSCASGLARFGKPTFDCVTMGER